jgi:hypothetical protein
VELEEASIDFKPPADGRPKMPEPLPVKLVAVEDCRAVAPAGIEVELDRFYVGLFGFERIESELAYRAENFRLIFEVIERPQDRDSMRAIGVVIPSLAEVERKLIDEEIDYVWQRGLNPGTKSILLRDPAGNWVELTESREIR